MKDSEDVAVSSKNGSSEPSFVLSGEQLDAQTLSGKSVRSTHSGDEIDEVRRSNSDDRRNDKLKKSDEELRLTPDSESSGARSPTIARYHSYGNGYVNTSSGRHSPIIVRQG
ncbi:MAG: hypothetical protein ACK559_22510, partial [bacterium]